jgi:hypothetical protein
MLAASLRARHGWAAAPQGKTEMQMRKTSIVTAVLAASHAAASPVRFPGGCSSPSAPLTSLSGVNTAHASMSAKIRRQDVIGVTHDGGGGQVSIPAFAGKVWHAHANCTAGTISLDLSGEHVEQSPYQMPVTGACSDGSIQAADAFRMLCPSYQGKITTNY